MSAPSPAPQRPYVGVHLLILQDNDVLLMRRSASTSGLQGQYTLIAGKVDEFENPSVAMIREAHEEIGITIAPENLKLLSIFHRARSDFKGQDTDIIEFIFTTHAWDSDIINKEPDLCDDLQFFALDNLPAPLSNSAIRALKCFHNKTPYIEVNENGVEQEQAISC